jgi:hypothetical protein
MVVRLVEGPLIMYFDHKLKSLLQIDGRIGDREILLG